MYHPSLKPEDILDEANPILLSDSYKTSHWKMYEEALQKMFSYLESRGGTFKYTVPYSLQGILMKYLAGSVITKERIRQAKALVDEHMGAGIFNEEGWQHILDDHDGRLPLLINAAPEGSIIPTHNIIMSVESQCEYCAWTTNYFETLLVQAWYGTTVATLSHATKGVILKFLQQSGDPSLIDFKLHDFGFRGVSSVESAGLGGSAHLVNFKGTDTMQALIYARNYYGAKCAGFSIPAAEHSTICSWGREREAKAFEHIITKAYPKGFVAVVSDSYDIYKACSDLWGTLLKSKVESRDGVLVIRPDSGNPPDVVLKVHEILMEKFGSTVNAKGYRELHPKVKVIQGDGVNYHSIPVILQKLVDNKISTNNVAFGMGGGLLQHVNRDTQKFAMKCSQVVVDAIPRAVFKDPVTDHGKKSKKGHLKLVLLKNGAYETQEVLPAQQQLEGHDGQDVLQTVFYKGDLMNITSFDEVRERAASQFYHEAEAEAVAA